MSLTSFRLILLLAAIVLVTPISVLSAGTTNARSSLRQPGREVKHQKTEVQPSQASAVKLGDSFERKLTGGQHHLYHIELATNEFLHIIVEQKGIDVVLAISGTTGSKLAEVDRPNGSRGRETFSFIAAEAGLYSLEIRSLEGVAAQGIYELRVDLRRPAVVQDAARIAAEQAVSEGERLRSQGSAESFAKAIKRFDESAKLWRSLNEPYEEAVALYGSGHSCISLGENQRAVEYLARALPLFKKETHGEAITRAAMGWPYMYLGDTNEALDSFSRAFELFHSEGNIRGEGLALYGTGWVRALRAEDQKALENFSESLSRRRLAKDIRGEAVTLTGLGKVEARMRNYEEAIDHFNQALNILPKPRDRYVEADILSNLGWVYNTLKQDRPAIEHFNQALELRRQTGDQIGAATTLYGISAVQRRLTQFGKAQAAIEEALKIIESLRALGSNQQLRISYFASTQEYYDFYISLLMQLDRLQPGAGYAAKALHASERARARALIDLLAATRIDMTRKTDPSPRHSVSLLAIGSATLTEPQPLTAPEIQTQILDQSTVLLEYALGEDRSYMWAVTSSEIASYELPPQQVIERLAREFYDSLTVRNHAELSRNAEAKLLLIREGDRRADQLACELSRLLLSRAADKLHAKRLVIVAPGVLQLVPFAALPVPPPRQGTDQSRSSTREPVQVAVPNNQRPLIVDHEIVVLPSATTLAVLRRQTKNRKPQPRAVAVVGDPVFSPEDERLLTTAATIRKSSALGKSLNTSGTRVTSSGSQEFPRLVSSRWEARGILSLVPPEDGKLLLDFAANRAAVTSNELANYRFVHFATHAVVDNQRPELSSIVLSTVDEQGRPRDGFLRSPDIFNLKLPVELVVLSACRTGLGKDFKGEGLVGLTRAFMYAGAPRVVVSLWDVDDKPTSELMVRFYKRMLGPEKLSPAAALRAAQLEFWKDPRWQSPYFWAAFILQGEWK